MSDIAMALLRHFYPEDTPLRRLLLHHSRQVADRALLIAARHPELELDTQLLEAGAMLHDIGICQCDAPGIFCTGTQPYICHGTLGAQMLRSLAGTALISDCADGCQVQRMLTAEALEPLARICERHTGTGLTRNQIEERGLPLPPTDLVPQTMEEQVVCYADKFYSKSHPERERTVEETERSLRKFGEEGCRKFLDWAQRFE